MVNMEPGMIIAMVILFGYLSVIFRENIFYRFASFTVIGLGTAYSCVLAIDRFRDNALTPLSAGADYMLIPVIIISSLLLFRISREYGWLARYPTAISLGMGLGLGVGPQMIVLMKQVQDAAAPVLTAATPLESVSGIISVLFTVITLFYFMFTGSIRSNNMVNWITRLGRYAFMIAVGGLCGAYVVGNAQWQGRAMQYIVWDWLQL